MKTKPIVIFLFCHFLFKSNQAAILTVCSMGCDHTTIMAAISAASPNDTIDVQNAVHTEANIDIDKNLTIRGQGQTSTIIQANAVQANAVDGVFKILTVGLTVFFMDMTIQNGNALSSSGSTLDLGGGVYITCDASTDVTFTNVTVTNNKSVGDRGGGVYIGGASGTVSFTNCVISGNEATGTSGDGGGVANRGASTVTFTKCTISGNTAGDDGGGYNVFEDGSVTKFINCTIFNNAAGGSSGDEGDGGGLYLGSAATFSLFNCTIVNNSLNTIATRRGGGVYHGGASTFNLSNTIIANNSGATSGNDLYVANGASTVNQTTCLVEDCAEGGGDCPAFSYWGDPNLAAVATCGVHSYFPTAARSFISDNGTAPSGDIPTDDICGTNRAAAKYDIGAYDDNALSTGLVETSTDIEAYFCTFIDNLPAAGLNNFANPSTGNLSTWETIIDNLLSHNTATAQTNAATLDYEVILFTDNSVNPNKLYYLVQKTAASSNYWGTYVFNPSPCREIVIQAPHPVFDSNTGKQAVYCLKNTNSRALLLAGTHRCNHSNPSNCDGTTEVCSGMVEKYRLSDLAHNDTTLFQVASDKLHDDIATSVLIQLHGFTPGMGDPDVILSNGTTFNPSGTDYANDFKTHLAATDGSLTFKVAHIDNWTYLIGSNNTQGRFINGENMPCNSPASAATGRFIHTEQEKTKLRDNSTGWEKVSTAMENLVACVVVPIELLDFQASVIENKVQLIWETASEENNYGFYVQRRQNSPGNLGNWETLGFVQGKGTSFGNHLYVFIDYHPEVGSNYYRLKQVDLDGEFDHSDIVHISFQDSGNSAKLRIIPNPVSNGLFWLSFDLAGFETGTSQIFDATGRLVLSQKVFNTQTQFNIQDFPKGIYTIILSVDGKQFFNRLILY